MDREETEAEKDLKSITAMGKRLKLSGRELSDYVHEHMSKLGYRSRRSYYSENDKGSGRRSGGGVFGFGGSSNDDDDD